MLILFCLLLLPNRQSPMVIALTGVAKPNGANVAAKVSATIPVRVVKGVSAMIFLRLWKISQLT
jgi:hypothetical protein